jgi:hypothetical protein
MAGQNKQTLLEEFEEFTEHRWKPTGSTISLNSHSTAERNSVPLKYKLVAQ